MKTILALTLFASLSASAATQTIKCYTRGATLELTLELSRANAIIGGEGQIAGQDLTPGVWYGLNGDVERENISEKNGKLDIHISTWNPSWDDPDSFNITLDRRVLGKSLKKGNFTVDVEHDGDEVTFDKKECYSFVQR